MTIKNNRKGDLLEDAFEKYFPKILEKAGFEVCKFHRVTSRTNDITDFDNIEFKHNYIEEKNINGIAVKTPKEDRYCWAIECKGKEGIKKNKVKHNELSSKAIGTQKKLKNVETWVILAPERQLDDKSYDLFTEEPRNLDFRFHIEIWDDTNLEFKKVFSILDKNAWKEFFPQAPYSQGNIADVTKYIKKIADKGKRKKEAYEDKFAGKIEDKETIIIEGRLAGSSKSFASIHLFLDEINNLLDKEFSIVKQIYYQNTWKLGLAYYQYKDTELTYTLYPIPAIGNDVQIKAVDESLKEKIKNEGLGFTGHFTENPIEAKPKEYAKEIVESKALKIIENRLLKHAGIDFLANEFIFAFIDMFHEQLGVPVKDAYTPAEIEKGFYEYLPFWLIESYKILKERNSLPRKSYLDPGVISFLRKEERQEVSKLVPNLLTSKTQIPQLPIGNTEMPFGIFVEFLEYVRQKGKDVQRPYIPKDFTRLVGKAGWVWSVFSKKDADRNLQIFFENLPQVYQLLIHNNFPFMGKELSLFGEATTIAVSWTVREEYQGYESGPIYNIFYLISEQDTPPHIITNLTDEESRLLFNFDFKKPDIDLRGRKYKVVSYTSGVLDFLYESTPMLNFIYRIVKERLKGYFKK